MVEAADALRAEARGNEVTYVVNRNINYTNICTYTCSFCAFSKTSSKAGFRDKPYDLDPAEVARRAREAVAKGATEVCLQGGIHPRYTGETYAGILRAVKQACPELHVHAFSPLEVHQGATTLGMSVSDFLSMLKDAGLGSLPGTAAEILDDEVRQVICPDKLTTQLWLDIVGAAHKIGLPTTSTILFGHIETPIHWARHLLAIRQLRRDRRLYRIRAAAAGPHEIADVPARAKPQGADLARSRDDACGVAYRVAHAHFVDPVFVGEAGRRWRGHAIRRLQRSWRSADEQKHQSRCRGEPWAGTDG